MMASHPKDEVQESSETYGAKFNMQMGMAHYVAEKLHLRPNEILDTWCVPELIVAYGHYMNEESQRSYQEWKQLDAQSRAKVAKPQEYVVKFYGV